MGHLHVAGQHVLGAHVLVGLLHGAAEDHANRPALAASRQPDLLSVQNDVLAELLLG